MKPGAVKFFPEDILILLQNRCALTTSELQLLAERKLGMSPATFYRLWKAVLNSPFLEIHLHNGKAAYCVDPKATIERPDLEAANQVVQEKIKAHNEAQKERADTPAKATAKKMPPLTHWDKKGDFKTTNSDAYQWLISQEEIAKEIFGKYSKQLVFDKETGKWSGIDYGKK